MKVVIRLFFFAVVFTVGSMFYGFFNQTSYAFSSGSPGGVTGSPGHGGATCTNCHGGLAAQAPNAITTNIPAEGYKPGETYTVTISFKEGTKTKYGFEARMEGADRTSKGTLIVKEPSRTRQLFSGTNATITHTNSGTTASSNTVTWTWDWIAPAKGTGKVTVYCAINASNNNGSDSGDKIYQSSLVISEAVINGISETKINGLVAFPNPTERFLFVQAEDSEIANLLDFTGKRLMSINLNQGSNTVDFLNIPTGTYFLTVGSGEVLRIIKL